MVELKKGVQITINAHDNFPWEQNENCVCLCAHEMGTCEDHKSETNERVLYAENKIEVAEKEKGDSKYCKQVMCTTMTASEDAKRGCCDRKFQRLHR